MSAVAARQIPEETDDPRNALLDAAADLIRRCRDHGCEAQLRARIDAILPPPAPPPAAPPTAPAETGDLWEASVIMTALVECRRKIKSPSSVKLIETAHGFAKARFEALKASGGPGA